MKKLTILPLLLALSCAANANPVLLLPIYVGVASVVAPAVASIAPTAAAAIPVPEYVGLHLGTWHSAPGFCSNTPGVFAKWQTGFTLGAYKNSECKSYSAYAGWSWETTGSLVRAAVTVGLVTGYMQAPVLPLVVPSVVVDLLPQLALRLTYVPKTASDSAHAVNFAVQHSFR